MADNENTVEVEGNEADTEEMEDVEGEDDIKTRRLTAEMMKDPKILAELQSRLGSIMESPASYIASLPVVVKRRIKALKKLQLGFTKLEAKFYEEVHGLECKYAQLYDPLYQKRHQITSGIVEPTDEECDFPSDVEKDDISEALEKKAHIEDEENKENEKLENSTEESKGVPYFWLTTLKNVDMLTEMIQEHDVPILKHLLDIKVNLSESNPMGFALEFHFEPNEYFSNTVLTKQYQMKCVPDSDDPFSFEGPEICSCKGCIIDWKKGKNVTVKTIKKKQKHKARGAIRTVTKTVQNDSFFNFFNPPTVPEDEEQIDEEIQSLLAADYDIGHFIKERIVPRAVLFFTGEALTDEDFEEEDEEDEDEEQDEEEEEEDEENEHHQVQKTKKQQQQPPECNQQ